MKKTIAIIATLDTKGGEVAYIKRKIEEQDFNVMIIDTGTLNKPVSIDPDITSADLAAAIGLSIEEIRSMIRGLAIEKITEGLKKVIKEKFSIGQFDGILALGGAEGTYVGTAAMRELPIGVPKVMLSTMASGKRTFGEYIGTKDIVMMHSVIDILGVNKISQVIYDNAAGAICGMMHNCRLIPEKGEKPTIAITMYGNTTRCVMAVKSLLESDGYEVIIFHANGIGGTVLEELIRENKFKAVIDITTHEIMDEVGGGNHSAGPLRLTAAAEKGVMQIVAPGCIDYMTMGPMDETKKQYPDRKIYYHNPTCALVRASREEMITAAKDVAGKLNRSIGATAVLLPLQGFSAPSFPNGGTLWDKEGDTAFIETLMQELNKDISVELVECHINDLKFSQSIYDTFNKMMRE